MPQLFVSYSRVDLEFTERLVEHLRRVYGLPNVWYDDELHGGVRWWQAITTQIGECDVFIYLLSNESVTSPYCKAEFTEAKRLQKPIVTAQIRDKTRMSDDLSEIQYVDMKRGMNADTLARLIRAINEQAALPKKRRALWTPLTPMPVVPTHEEAGDSSRRDVETPTLEVKVPAPIGGRTGARATIIGAALTGLLGILAVVIGVILPPLINPSATPAATATTGQVVQAGGDTPTLTYTPTNTDAPLLTATTPPTLDMTGVFGQAFANATATEAANRTATVDAYTDTPTPNFTATLDAVNTAVIQTIIADNWTDTPTPTPTSTSTATPTVTFTPTDTPIPLGYPGNPVTANAQWTPVSQEFDGVPMVLVPAGSFTIGANPQNDDERNGGVITFDEPFWIDQTEVTQADFERLGGVKANANYFDGNQRPVEQITWFEARDFCALRGARLPTEAEWEYAARGPDGLVYPWGNDWNPDNAVWRENSNRETVNVGSIPAGRSWVAALDMSGNVWEWVSSLYLPYDSTEDREADTGDRTDVQRVVRGGSWSLTGTGLRGASRYRVIAVNGFNFNGFRCARSS